MRSVVERDTDIEGAEPPEQAESPRPGLLAHLPAASFAAFGIYAAVALVAIPEGTPSPFARGVALLAIAGGTTIVVVVARWAPAWARGSGMLLAGSAMVAVLAGVVLERALRAPSVGSILGLVAGLGGVCLVVVGWQHLLVGVRRRWVRVVAAVVGTVLVAQFLVLPAAVALTVTNRARPEGSGRTPADLRFAFEDVRLSARDGTRLAAWWIPARNGAAVIVLPGSGSTRDDVLDHAAMLAEAGYGALLVDPRGHGESEGRLMDLGWGAEEDVREAVSSVLDRPEVTGGVGVLGLSMGGEVALTAAALDPRIGAVVAEGATARTWDDVRGEPNPHPVGIANEWLTFGLVDMLAPEEPPMPLLEAIGLIHAPVLLIEGNGPKEPTLGPVYAAAGPETVTLWALPDTPHVSAIRVHRDEYERGVLDTFDVLRSRV
ncbi:MAG TPA: alpha/beta fold hydrolase [Actinomycetota bacterium]|nr:alpha/beta fold hydrolase [Actinomycetota bacterium]